MSEEINGLIKFVQLIEAHLSVYDHTRKEFWNNELKSKAWEEIASEANSTVAECQEKWENVRKGYIQAPNEANGSGIKHKRMSSVNEHLRFIDPFLKSTPQTDDVTIAEGVNDKAKSEDTENETVTKSPAKKSNKDADSQRNSVSNTETGCVRNGNSALDQLNIAATAYFEERTSKRKAEYDNHLNFFKSIIPDLYPIIPPLIRQLKVDIVKEVDIACKESVYCQRYSDSYKNEDFENAQPQTSQLRPQTQLQPLYQRNNNYRVGPSPSPNFSENRGVQQTEIPLQTQGLQATPPLQQQLSYGHRYPFPEQQSQQLAPLQLTTERRDPQQTNPEQVPQYREPQNRPE